MAHINIHCEDCVKQLGESFRQVHEWLDEFAGQMGPKHRDERHHVNGVEEVREKWGDEAALAAEIHIKKDCSNRVPTMQEIAMWKLFS